MENIQLLFIKNNFEKKVEKSPEQPGNHDEILQFPIWNEERKSIVLILMSKVFIFVFVPCIEGRNKLISFTSMSRGRERESLFCLLKLYKLKRCFKAKNSKIQIPQSLLSLFPFLISSNKCGLWQKLIVAAAIEGFYMRRCCGIK